MEKKKESAVSRRLFIMAAGVGSVAAGALLGGCDGQDELEDRPEEGTKPIALMGLHHSANRCRDAEETRVFYEDFMGLPLAASLRRDHTESGVETPLIHIFFEMRDGSYLAFFELPKVEFDFKDQDPSDLHIALEVDEATMTAKYQKAQGMGWAPYGPAELEALTSIYFRDPNGYVVELTTKKDVHDEVMDPEQNDARAILDRWQVDKTSI